MYLIWSNEHRAWWGRDGWGYTTELSKAGYYSRDEALAICRQAALGQRGGIPQEVPVLAADAHDCLRG